MFRGSKEESIKRSIRCRTLVTAQQVPPTFKGRTKDQLSFSRMGEHAGGRQGSIAKILDLDLYCD